MTTGSAAADTDNDGVDDVFYKWDALGRRVGRDDGTDDVVYFQDGQQTLADYAAGAAAASPTYTYIYGSYIDEPVLRTDSSGSKRYYHRNQQYSIVALTDGAGAISERYAYRAYGELTVLDGSGTVTTTDNRYTYTGREWDGSWSCIITGRGCMILWRGGSWGVIRSVLTGVLGISMSF